MARVSPKVLTKLNPKSAKLEMGLGGEQEITWEMVAAAKSKMDFMVSLYAEIAWNDSHTAHSRAEFLKLLTIRVRHEIERRWLFTQIHVRNEMAEKMALLLIAEIEIEKGHCGVCKGACTRKIGNKQVVCNACMGWGKKLLSGAQRADIVGIHKTSWHRTWERRFTSYVLPIISDLHRDMVRILNKELTKE